MAAAYLRNSTGTGGLAASVVSTSSFTPATQDLLVVFANLMAASSDSIRPELTSDAGITFGRATSTYWGAGNPNFLAVYIAAARVGTAQAMTCSINWGVNTCLGCSFIVCGVQGMQKVGGNIGLGAEQQSIGTTGAAAGIPTFTTVTADPNNVVLTCVAELVNPPAVTVPTGFTALGSIGHLVPTAGLQVAQRGFGYNGANLAWGGSTAGVYGGLFIELASGGLVSADRPQFMVGTGI